MAEKEYIDREAATELLKQRLYETALNSTGFNADAGDVYADAAERLEKTWINELPVADVRPAVRGHIEEDENTYLFCSECNCNITLATYETPNGNLILRPNFCPNCGADMRPQPPKEE